MSKWGLPPEISGQRPRFFAFCSLFPARRCVEVSGNKIDRLTKPGIRPILSPQDTRGGSAPFFRTFPFRHVVFFKKGMYRMISYKEADSRNNFCKCIHSSSVFTEMDDWGYWDVCSDCHKPIEDTYRYNSEDYLEKIMNSDDSIVVESRYLKCLPLPKTGMF